MTLDRVSITLLRGCCGPGRAAPAVLQPGEWGQARSQQRSHLCAGQLAVRPGPWELGSTEHKQPRAPGFHGKAPPQSSFNIC